MPSALGRGIDQALSNLDLSQQIPLNDTVPLDPSRFYDSFGYLQHPKTKLPVKQLAPYQLKVWSALLEQQRVLAIKSHKIGVSTSQLLSDFQLAILPSSSILSSRGYDTLLISQTKDIAKELLRTLRRMILRSKRYNKYLIDKPSEIEEYGSGRVSYKSIMKDEQTKTSVIYIRNPEDETRPSRIIALGADNPGSMESWPNIHNVHLSDITAAIGDYSDSLNVAITRLANTGGTMTIETIPDFAGSCNKESTSMKRNAEAQNNEAISPADQLVKAYDDLAIPLLKEHSDKRESILKNHKMQLRSAAAQASDPRSTVVKETNQGFAIYTMLHLTKPLYRKLESIAQLYDQPINECICEMLEAEVQGTLDNCSELGDALRKRILEEAYDLGREDSRARKDRLEVELEGEKLP